VPLQQQIPMLGANLLVIGLFIFGELSSRKKRKGKTWWRTLITMFILMGMVSTMLVACDPHDEDNSNNNGGNPPPEDDEGETPDEDDNKDSSDSDGSDDGANGENQTPEGESEDRCEIDEPEVKWLEGDFTITHYTYALESDPLYADDQKVSAKGLPADKKYRWGFLYGEHGIMQQGTGLAEDGQYITIQYWGVDDPDPEDPENTTFKYGIGGRYSNPRRWQTVATGDSRLGAGNKIVIEIYEDKGELTVADTGGDVGAEHIDVFVGAITIDEALRLGTKTSRVRIAQP
jgi:3D (Asp-Asp-Asp) domain-containing protein